MRQVEKCPICGNLERAIVHESTLERARAADGSISPYGGHYRINRCTGCGLLFSDPVLDAAQVDGLYEGSGETNVEPGEERNVRRTMAGYYGLLRPHLKQRRRILDVGCDMGFLLEVAHGDGFAELCGIEPNPTARAVAQKLPGARISSQFYEHADHPGEHFDAITLVHVLDHLYDPRAVLQRAWGNLAPGGVLLAVVHDVESLLARVLKERFPVFNLYHHFFFSKTTLAALVRSCGFEVIDVHATRNCYSAGFFTDRIPLLPAALKRGTRRALDAVGIGRIPISVRIGNIGLVARRPLEAAAGDEPS